MPVLVTGSFGLVGLATVRQLAADGQQVVATDLDVPGNRKAAPKFEELMGVDVRYADLTDAAAVDALIAEVDPTAIIHLAAIIPPTCYARPELAYQVNVGGTANLLSATQKHSSSTRFIQASSIAVYGSRNPHRSNDLLTADTPTNPSDIYGSHKVEAEGLVRSSKLDWVILRLGGVLTVDMAPLMNLDNMHFEGALPVDNRINTVDVRDVASAFAAATTAPVVGETLLIGGDPSHRLLQGEIAQAISAAMGLVGGLPTGLPGDPGTDKNWFATDWMDTTRSQEILGYQRHSWPDLLVETADKTGWLRPVLRLAAPISREILKRRAPYHRAAEPYADPWGAVEAKWGDPRPQGRRA